MRPFLCCLALLPLATSGLAQTVPAPAPQAAPAGPVAPAPQFEARAKELPAMLRGEVAYDAFFTPRFREAVPQDRFAATNTQLAASLGKPVAFAGMEMSTPWSGTVSVQFEKAVVRFSLAVEQAAPNQVAGLRVAGVGMPEKSMADVLSALAKLPGSTGFALAKLGSGGPQFVQQQGANTPMAIGSEFKLVILAELVRAVAVGERKWDDMVTLDGRPLPGGGYTQKPAGTRVSLRELATQMISISDNSATDILIDTLGRARIEAMLPVVGIADPKGMRPFLKTLDAFKLKSLAADGKLDWGRMDEAARRAAIDGEIGKAGVQMVKPEVFAARVPRSIDTIEWFASPADMIRAMDWLRRHTESGPAAEARAILSKNPGIAADVASGWQFVGFKGGSEPGVIAMTFLLQAKDGSWWAASGSWNDTAHEIETVRFAGLMSRAIELSTPK